MLTPLLRKVKKDRSAQTLKPVILSAPVGWACREAPGVHHLQPLSRDLTSNQALLKHMPPLSLHLIPGGNHTSNLQIQHHVSPGRKQRRTTDSSPIFWGPLSTPADSRDLSGLVPPPRHCSPQGLGSLGGVGGCHLSSQVGGVAFKIIVHYRDCYRWAGSALP